MDQCYLLKSILSWIWIPFSITEIRTRSSNNHGVWQAQRFISVEANYRYLAYCVDGLHIGKYVFAEEPEFESTSVVASNIEHAIDWLFAKTLRNDIQASYANV